MAGHLGVDPWCWLGRENKFRGKLFSFLQCLPRCIGSQTASYWPDQPRCAFRQNRQQSAVLRYHPGQILFFGLFFFITLARYSLLVTELHICSYLACSWCFTFRTQWELFIKGWCVVDKKWSADFSIDYGNLKHIFAYCFNERITKFSKLGLTFVFWRIVAEDSKSVFPHPCMEMNLLNSFLDRTLLYLQLLI